MKEQMIPKIRCENLWKIFGPEPKKLIQNWKTFDSKISKTELKKKTGCIVGVQNASISINQGEIFVLMGLSGSGKSTLLRCLNRLHEPTSGKIFIDDQDITTLLIPALREMRRKKTGMVFQHFGLLPHRSLVENVAFGLKIQGLNKNQRHAKAIESLELVGLKGWEKSYPHELSGGMQQRVGLARALATDPEILLMDEAFSALDPLIRRQMQDEFIKLLQQVHKTIVFVTHDLHEALRLADNIAVMKFGAIVQQGTPEEIVLHPGTNYVAEFVKDLPKTKFITASSIMQSPEKWSIRSNASDSDIIEKMIKEETWYAYLVDETRKIQGIADLFQLHMQKGSKNLQKKLMNDDYPTARPDTFLEDLICTAKKTRFPIAVKDGQGQLVGIISAQQILGAITKA